MKISPLLIRIFAIVILLTPRLVLANEEIKSTTDGKLGELLSVQLYCGVKGLVEGNLGLAIGLLIMFVALWSLVKGGKAAPAIVSILFGASITALPSLIESAMSGLAQLMQETKLTAENATFTPPKQCGNIRQQIEESFKIQDQNLKDKVCYGGIDCR